MQPCFGVGSLTALITADAAWLNCAFRFALNAFYFVPEWRSEVLACLFVVLANQAYHWWHHGFS